MNYGSLKHPVLISCYRKKERKILIFKPFCYCDIKNNEIILMSS